jgi:alanine-alpha-ketoisovalerate/valine-pyruvate aminotransferase
VTNTVNKVKVIRTHHKNVLMCALSRATIRLPGDLVIINVGAKKILKAIDALFFLVKLLFNSGNVKQKNSLNKKP